MKKRLFLLLGALVLCIFGFVYVLRFEIQTLYRKIFSSSLLQIQNNDAGAEEQKIKITFLDIGQGDASFIEWPNSTQMLIDCALDARILEALGRVMTPLDRTIDYLVITHPDQDHYGGCIDVMKRFEIKHIVYSGYKKNNSQYFPIFLQTVQEESRTGAEFHEINHEQIWNINSSTLHFLYPDAPVNTHPLTLKSKKNPSNNTSILMILQYGNKKVMFTGDAELEEENYIMKKYPPEILDIDVHKVGHHGSAGSTSDAFLKIITPEYSTISSGKENKYGHPTLRTLRRLERSQTEVWRTDQNGDIILHVYKDTLYVENQ